MPKRHFDNSKNNYRKAPEGKAANRRRTLKRVRSRLQRHSRHHHRRYGDDDENETLAS